MKKTLCILIISVCSLSLLKAQTIEDWVLSKGSILFEKVYLQPDRHIYSPGDYIWFKAWLTSGLTNQPMPGYKNIYVQLVADDGSIVDDRIILAQNGAAHGDILIGRSFEPGQYTLRAFTKYLANFSPESFFHQDILIVDVKNPPPPGFAFHADSETIDVSFLPEGGNMVIDALNHIAFRAVNNKGYPIDVSGSVVDENDSLVTRFETRFSGMGRFVMMPREGKRYFAKIDGHPGFRYEFASLQSNGLTLHSMDNDNEFIFSVVRNIVLTDTTQVFIAGSHKGIVLFYEALAFSGISGAVSVEKSMFPPGISKITLLDHHLNELAERLVFVDYHDDVTPLIGLNKSAFTTREQVEVNVQLPEIAEDSISLPLSMVVVNRDYLSSGEYGNTLKSYLLVDSELRGPMESPERYFGDEENISQAEKLDLLMMVNGWRSYYWDDLVVRRNDLLSGWDDAGITIEGYVRALFRNRPVNNGTVALGPFSNSLLYESTFTDDQGRFRLDRIYLRDHEKTFVHALNANDRRNTEIELDPLMPLRTKEFPLDSGNWSRMIIMPRDFFRQNYMRYSKLNEFYPDDSSILLDNINVFGKRIEQQDSHFRVYGEPDRSFSITDDDLYYTNVLDYLSTKAGIVVSGDQISMRGGGPPLILVDGLATIMVDEALKYTPLSEIDKIEILISGHNLTFFGSKGGNGVISIFTKRGDGTYEINKYVRGRKALQTRGFRKPVQFYSPKYTPENIDQPAPDFRPALHWEPELLVEDNSATISFYTSDEEAAYIILLQGLTAGGRIISVQSEFDVSQ